MKLKILSRLRKARWWRLRRNPREKEREPSAVPRPPVLAEGSALGLDPTSLLETAHATAAPEQRHNTTSSQPDATPISPLVLGCVATANLPLIPSENSSSPVAPLYPNMEENPDAPSTIIDGNTQLLSPPNKVHPAAFLPPTPISCGQTPNETPCTPLADDTEPRTARPAPAHDSSHLNAFKTRTKSANSRLRKAPASLSADDVPPGSALFASVPDACADDAKEEPNAFVDGPVSSGDSNVAVCSGTGAYHRDASPNGPNDEQGLADTDSGVAASSHNDNDNDNDDPWDAPWVTTLPNAPKDSASVAVSLATSADASTPPVRWIANPRMEALSILAPRIISSPQEALQILHRLYVLDKRIDISPVVKRILKGMRDLQPADFVNLILHQPETDSDYTIFGCLSSNSLNWVFQARRSDGVDVAIKLINKSREYVTGGKIARQQMEIEVELLGLSRASDVEHLVQSLASWSDSCFVYVVMPLLSGSLSSLHKLSPPWPPKSPVYKYYAAQLIIAVSALHRMGYAHRDLKPENVLFTSSGSLVLADLGFAYRFGSPTDHYVGTPGYIAPEVLAEPGLFDEGYDAKLDVWSLGVVLLELFSKMENPYMRTHETEQGGKEVEVRNEETFMRDPAGFSVMQMIKSQNRILHNLLLRMLCRNPAQRASMREVKDHPFFADIKWGKLDEWARKNNVTPFIPHKARLKVKRQESPPQSIWANENVLALIKEDIVALQKADPYWTSNGISSQARDKIPRPVDNVVS